MRDINKLDLSQKPAAIRAAFEEYSPSDIRTVDDHKVFINKLAGFRTDIKEYTEQNGTNFLQFLENTLSVGEDGLYSNKLRFIYELIQNVDDCNYLDTNKCELDIKFDWNVGNIILTYNETGFEPLHVFSITGIAEKSKNISSDKVEIGEKGIGFKSVFGIADSVLIQSGKFSFEFYKNDFTIPVPYYGDNFEEVEGTRLTLRVGADNVKNIYEELVKLYSSNVSLLNNNPILFLNKLTKLCFYNDEAHRYINFNVSGALSAGKENVLTNDVVTVSVDIKNHLDGGDSTAQNKIECYRYKMPIVYVKSACISRYGSDVGFDEKKHNLIAYVPIPPEPEKFSDLNSFGLLYSFLPTQVKMTVPLIIHAPYKLDASREFIDPQEEGNGWFHFTNNQLGEFLSKIYADLAVKFKEDIVEYLPKGGHFLNCNDSDKLERLKVEALSEKILENEKLFYTEDKTYETASGVVAFSANENIDNPIDLYLLLDLKKPLFKPNRKTNMRIYGVKVVEDAYAKLFCRAIDDPTVTAEALSVLSLRNDFDFNKAVESLGSKGSKKINTEQVALICSYNNIKSAFQKSAIDRIKKNMRPLFILDPPMAPIKSADLSILRGAVSDADLGKDGDSLLKYINLISHHYSVLSKIAEDVFFPCENTLVLSESESISSFASFAEKFVGKAFGAPLRLREESEKLNKATLDETMGNAEYLSMLQRSRENLITILGKPAYNNYIQIINKSGSDTKRFINELLQNADDCEYSSTRETPVFSCVFNGKELYTSYNEDGFSKANVRSITAIGESTKKQIHSSSQAIGEKGVGFKSVFNIASEVSIHSNGFDFKLTVTKPTVPKKMEAIKGLTGTKMIFTLREPTTSSPFSDEDVIALCLCLRKLKKVKIGGASVEIEDLDTERIINLNGKKYRFTKFEYTFEITDAAAIAERENKQRKISPNQTIHFYLPADKMKQYKLYTGLPTLIQLEIPLIIDAPFEVTTSREGVLQKGLWNPVIRKEMYNALVAMLHSIKEKEKIGVFAYIKEKGIFSDDWLNTYNLQEPLSNAALIPLMDGSFVAPSQQECWIYTDFCRYLFANKMASLPKRNIVDSAKHIETLIWLGCKTRSTCDMIDAIVEAVQGGHISNEIFRKQLYSSLTTYAQKIKEANYRQDEVNKLPIIPTKSKQGTLARFVSKDEKIYVSTDSASTDEYYLLDDNLLSADDYYKIFNTHILPLDDTQKEKLYRDKIIALLSKRDKRAVAKTLLAEFIHNRPMFELCKKELKGRIEQVPVQFCDEGYDSGNKFINDCDSPFCGGIVNGLIVAPEYHALAEFLECSSVQSIHYEDIDVDVAELSADDIEDFLHGDFLNRIEIIQGFICDGKIHDGLIEQYDLSGMDSREPLVSDFDFPSNPIVDLLRIRQYILSAQLNEISIQEVVKSERRPAFDYDKKGYALREYECETNFHACQMCKKPIQKKYIVINSIEYEPKYAWEQMQLCFCLKCSKDFELLRNNEKIRSGFLIALSNADINVDEPIAVPIGPYEIYFTATHLAEVQEILKLKNVEDEVSK